MLELVLFLTFASIVLIYIELRWSVVPILKKMGLFVEKVDRSKIDLARIAVPRALNLVEKASVGALGLGSSFEVEGLLETRKDYKQASTFYYGEIEISYVENFDQKMMAREGSICSVKCFNSRRKFSSKIICTRAGYEYLKNQILSNSEIAISLNDSVLGDPKWLEDSSIDAMSVDIYLEDSTVTEMISKNLLKTYLSLSEEDRKAYEGTLLLYKIEELMSDAKVNDGSRSGGAGD